MVSVPMRYMTVIKRTRCDGLLVYRHLYVLFLCCSIGSAGVIGTFGLVFFPLQNPSYSELEIFSHTFGLGHAIQHAHLYYSLTQTCAPSIGTSLLTATSQLPCFFFFFIIRCSQDLGQMFFVLLVCGLCSAFSPSVWCKSHFMNVTSLWWTRWQVSLEITVC